MPLSACAAEALPDPASAAFRSEPALRHQVFAAFHRAPEHVGGLRVAIKPQQAEYRAGAAADDVELLVGGNQSSVNSSAAACASASKPSSWRHLRHHGQRIDDRAQARWRRRCRAIAPCAPRCGLSGSCEDAQRRRAQVRRTMPSRSPPHARRETARCRTRRCRDRDRGTRAGTPRQSPSQSRPIHAAPGPRRMAWRAARRRSCRLPR